MQKILLIVGLGNPGLKYKKTRHNVGFRVLDEFRKKQSFPRFKLNKKLRVEISASKKVVLAKPQTFMNNSGLAVKELVKELISLQRKEPSSLPLVVVHDDFDLDFGEVKISENIGSGGHHGVQSIIDSLKTRGFKRIRIGIRPNYQLSITNYQPNLKAEDFVLKKFSKTEEKLLAEIFCKAHLLLKQSLDG